MPLRSASCRDDEYSFKYQLASAASQKNGKRIHKKSCQELADVESNYSHLVEFWIFNLLIICFCNCVKVDVFWDGLRMSFSSTHFRPVRDGDDECGKSYWRHTRNKSGYRKGRRKIFQLKKSFQKEWIRLQQVGSKWYFDLQRAADIEDCDTVLISRESLELWLWSSNREQQFCRVSSQRGLQWRCTGMDGGTDLHQGAIVSCLEAFWGITDTREELAPHNCFASEAKPL